MIWATRGLAAFLALGAVGCASIEDAAGPPPEILSEGERRSQAAGNDSSVLDIVGGVQAGNVRIGSAPEDALVGAVNKHLWRASLETLAFLPIASTDPFTGVIATDWGAAPDAPGERFKVTAYVTDTALTPNALRVAVFRERMERGVWTPAPVAAETPRRLEDSILVRARQLRIAEAEGQG